MRTVRTEAGLFVVVGVMGILALGVIGGAVDSPHADGVSYEVTFPNDRFLVPQSERQSTPPLSQVSVGGQTLALPGRTGWLASLGGVAVLAISALIALRTMGGPAVVLMTITGVLLLTLILMVGPGGTPAGGATTNNQSLSWPEQILFFLVGLVTVLSGVALFLPDDADAYSTTFAVVTFLGEAFEDLRTRAASDSTPDRVVPPDNDVYRVWQEFTDRYSPDEVSRPADTLTPGDVSCHAESARAPPEAVTELRRIFEAVRYGPHDPSEKSITRAQCAWDRITQQADTGDACDDA